MIVHIYWDSWYTWFVSENQEGSEQTITLSDELYTRYRNAISELHDVKQAISDYMAQTGQGRP